MNHVLILPQSSDFRPPEGCAPRTPFADDDELKDSMCGELRRLSEEFYETDTKVEKVR